MSRIQRILVPVDFSEFCRQALTHAVVLASRHHATLVALHVMESLPPRPDGAPSAFPGLETMEPDARNAVLAELGKFVEPAIAAGVPVTTQLAEGSPAREVVAYAKDKACDLIVMGTHGRSGFERLMVGSVAEKVLRQSTVSVLIVPPAEKDRPVAAFSDIVCPVDFSPASMKALEYALALAKDSGGRLTLLHVVEFPDEEPLETRHFSVPEYRRYFEEGARKKLEESVPAADRKRITLSIEVVAGRPYRQILELARKRNADLIVMGVIGRGNLDLILFGSTTQHVVRAATCPVLTLRAG